MCPAKIPLVALTRPAAAFLTVTDLGILYALMAIRARTIGNPKSSHLSRRRSRSIVSKKDLRSIRIEADEPLPATFASAFIDWFHTTSAAPLPFAQAKYALSFLFCQSSTMSERALAQTRSRAGKIPIGR